jgi:hypothetical protein
MVHKRRHHTWGRDASNDLLGDHHARTGPQAIYSENVGIRLLNHHVHNALTQIIMASNVTDIGKHDRYMQEAVGRISETLFRVGKQSGLAGLSLDVDLAGTDLNRGREEREKQWKARGA